MDIQRLIKFLLKRYKIIIGSALLMGILMYFFTRNIPKRYESTATIYTGIGSRISIDSKSSDGANPNTLFSNFMEIITSRETLKEAGLKLLASHLMLEHADPQIISEEHLIMVREMIPDDIKAMKGATESITYANLEEAAITHPFLIGIINYPSPYYSIAALSSVYVERTRESDMLFLAYSCNDPGVCQKTLDLLINISILSYRKITEGQLEKAVEYFQEQLETAYDRLKQSEERLLTFNRVNNLVDYTSQTSIAIAQREQINDRINQERDNISSIEAALKKLEDQMGGQAQSLKTKEIIEKREQLSKLTLQITVAELNGASPGMIARLQSEKNQVTDELNRNIEGISNTPTSGKIPDIASSYFTRIVSYEESKARLQALERRRNANVEQYEKIIPIGDTLKRIQREIEINEKVYLAALDELNNSKRRQQDQHSFSFIQVIDKPNYPLTAKSTRKMMILIGLMIGGTIPIAIFTSIFYFNNNILTLQRAEHLTGLKTGGILPDIKKLKTYKHARLVSNSLSDIILKNIYLIEQHEEHPQQQRILIVSTRSSEGKTTIGNMLCERIISKGRRCLVMVPYMDISGNWSVASYKVDTAAYQAHTEGIVPVEKLNEAEILILELPSLILNDYPVELIKQFNMAFLVCDANRQWAKADQTALDTFISISGLTPYLILNNVDKDVVEEVLGKV
ncbi:MAG: hypothetical protein LBS09_05200 [Bacteroidales bacterium]|jgi:uncharacterized protein involved in exopolysaccharide biosynthesis|nr:hypothetical protein [Bacteroidales bacterium]